MPKVCTVCRHPKRREIDRALLEQKPLRYTAQTYGTSLGALQRHKLHLSDAVVKAQAAREVIRDVAREVAAPTSLLSDVRDAEGRAGRLYNTAEEILHRALEAKDLGTALKAVAAGCSIMSEARGYMEMRGQLTGELNTHTQVPHALQVMQVLMLPVQQEPARIVDAK
jgi:hypothetical protein